MNTREALKAILTIFLWLVIILIYTWVITEIASFSAIIGITTFFISLFLILFILFRFIFTE